MSNAWNRNKTLIYMYMQASRRSRIGVGMNRSARYGKKFKADWILRYIKTTFTFFTVNDCFRAQHIVFSTPLNVIFKAKCLIPGIYLQLYM